MCAREIHMNHPDRDVQLTDEDVQTVKKCRDLSFWFGSVPFTIGSCVAVGVFHNMGFFANRPKLLVPSYFFASIFGFLGGKLSYMNKCKQMFLDLNDSRIKDYILQSKGFPPLNPAPDSPLIVNTPVKPDEGASKPMTYAERRAYFRNHPESLRPKPQTTPSQEEPSPDRHDEGLSIFNDDRPSGSFQFDDIYRPRD
ncbi:unnamed protein product [Dicrocoelium dendriticum]|nr:unnamed protein product [Dicrocoelium dendriticum]